MAECSNTMTGVVTSKIVIEGNTYYAPVHNQLEIDMGPYNARRWVNIVDAIVQALDLRMYTSDTRLRITVERVENKEQ